MKIAKLPDGTELEFDEALSDDAIAAAVRRHLGYEDDDDDDSAIDIEELLLEFVGVAKGLRSAIEAMTKSQLDSGRKMEALARGIKDMATTVGEAVQAQGKAVREMTKGVADAHKAQAATTESVAKRLYDLGRTISEDKGELKALGAGFAALGAKVDAAASDVVDALRAPKTIRHDKEGRPVGLDVK